MCVQLELPSYDWYYTHTACLWHERNSDSGVTIAATERMFSIWVTDHGHTNLVSTMCDKHEPRYVHGKIQVTNTDWIYFTLALQQSSHIPQLETFTVVSELGAVIKLNLDTNSQSHYVTLHSTIIIPGNFPFQYIVTWFYNVLFQYTVAVYFFLWIFSICWNVSLECMLVTLEL